MPYQSVKIVVSKDTLGPFSSHIKTHKNGWKKSRLQLNLVLSSCPLLNLSSMPTTGREMIRSSVLFPACKSISRYCMVWLLLRLTRGLKWTAAKRLFCRIQSASPHHCGHSVCQQKPSGTLHICLNFTTTSAALHVFLLFTSASLFLFL